MQTGRINGSHVAQSQNDDRIETVEVCRLLQQLLRGAKEKWPVNAEDRDVCGHVLVLQTVFAAMLDVIGSDYRDGGGIRHAVYIQERRQRHAYLNGDRD